MSTKFTHCPLCFSELEEKDVAPCAECGHIEGEIEHAQEGRHTFAEMRVFGGLSVVLCSFHQVDFASFQPEFLGLNSNARFGFKTMQFMREVPVFIGKDKVCPQCNLRLAFLKFVVAARELHENTEGKAVAPSVWAQNSFVDESA
jgi:hypothetical protein